MKKIFLVLLIAVSAGLVRAEEIRLPRKDYVDRVNSCLAILQEFQRNPELTIPAAVFKEAKAIVITNQFKAGFILGVKDGYGVVMAKKADGSWSVPVIVAAGEASLGLQIGGTDVETIYIITDEETTRKLYQERFNIGVDAKAIAGPHDAQVTDQRPILAPILVYMKSKGFYVGATVKAGYLARADLSNKILYNTRYTMPELLFSDWVEPVPEVKDLMNYVQTLAP